MDKTEIVKRLENIAKHAVHVIGEPPFIMSLDDGIALDEAVLLLKEQEPKLVKVDTRKVLDGETDDGPIFIMDTFYRCPSCGSVFSRTNKSYDIHYCEHCGQAVKWDA